MKTIFALLLFPALAIADTLVVTTAEDEFDQVSGAFLSLREALRDAANEETTITFAPSLSGQTIYTGTRGQLSLFSTGGKVTIDASDLAQRPVISGLRKDGGVPVNHHQFAYQDRHLEIRSLIIEDVPQQGFTTLGSEDDLTLVDVVIRRCGMSGVSFGGDRLEMRDCEVYQNGGASEAYRDGGISAENGQRLSLIRCAIYQNSGSGMILPKLAASYSSILDSTIAENGSKALANVGGIMGTGGSKADIQQCTVVDNLGYGIGSVRTDSLRLGGVVIGRNRLEDGTTASLFGSGITSNGYNLCDDAPAALSKTSDVLSRDPLVTRIGYHGGKILSCYPLQGSPAINGGNAWVVNTTANRPDTRGFARMVSNILGQRANIIDIGAVEVNTENTFTVRSASNEGAGTFKAAIEGQGPSHRRIVFDPSMSGKTIDVLTGNLVRGDWHVEIDGTNLAEPVTLASSVGERVLVVQDQAGISANGIIFSGIARASSGTYGGLSFEKGTSLGMSRCQLGPNSNRILLLNGLRRVHLNEVYVFANSISLPFIGAGDAGAIYAIDTEWIQIWNSSFRGNRVRGGTVARGGGLRSTGGRFLELWNSTWYDNEAFRQGGALFCDEGHFQADFSTFSENQSLSGMIGLGAEVRASVNRCLFVDNSTYEATTSNIDFMMEAGAMLKTAESWTTVEEDPSGFYAGNNEIGAALSLSAFELDGGFVPTQSLLGSDVAGPSIWLRAMDARGELGSRDGSLMPGAVQSVIVDGGGLKIVKLEIQGDDLQVTVSNPTGVRWQMFVTTNLIDFDETEVYVDPGMAGETTLIVPWEGTLPSQLFFRFGREL